METSMSKMDRIEDLLKENPSINKGTFCEAQTKISNLRKAGILRKPEYLLDPVSAFPPAIRVDHAASR